MGHLRFYYHQVEPASVMLHISLSAQPIPVSMVLDAPLRPVLRMRVHPVGLHGMVERSLDTDIPPLLAVELYVNVDIDVSEGASEAEGYLNHAFQ